MYSRVPYVSVPSMTPTMALWTWGDLCSDVTTAADQVTCFSNSADFLTILAPGAFIDAAGVRMQGTSQATPHVAGAVAVLMEVNPALTPDTVEFSMTSSGPLIDDTRNGLTFPRLDLAGAASVAAGQSAAVSSFESFTVGRCNARVLEHHSLLDGWGSRHRGHCHL